MLTPKKSIQCTTEPLEELIEKGETIDFRLNEAQWADLTAGDIIEYWEDFTGWQTKPALNSRKVLTKIIAMFHAASFADLIDHPNLQQFFDGHEKDKIIKGLRHWWTEEKEEKTGVLGLRVKLIQSP